MKIAQFQYFRECANPIVIAMNAAAPEGTPPRRFNYLITSHAWPLKSLLLGCHSYLHNFSWMGENHSRSCPFLLSQFFYKGPKAVADGIVILSETTHASVLPFIPIVFFQG